MAKRYRVYSVNRRMDGNPRHYLSGDRCTHHWSGKGMSDTYTPLQAIKKMKHVTGVVRSGGNSQLSFAIEAVDNDTTN